jgi:hypothetical protein
VLPVGPARLLQHLWRARSGARSTVHATSPVRHRGPVTGAAVPTPCSAARRSVRSVETFAAERRLGFLAHLRTFPPAAPLPLGASHLPGKQGFYEPSPDVMVSTWCPPRRQTGLIPLHSHGLSTRSKKLQIVPIASPASPFLERLRQRSETGNDVWLHELKHDPPGKRSARTGWHGGMKPGGPRRRQAGTGERINIGRICAGRAGSALTVASN